MEKDRDWFQIKCLHKTTCYYYGTKPPRFHIKEAAEIKWNRRVEK